MGLGLIGRKLGMTQIFSEEGKILPVTVVEAGPCTVVQIKTVGKDGYNALQLGYLEKKIKKVNKPLQGHFSKSHTPPFYFLKEFKVEGVENHNSGQKVTLDLFQVGEVVSITGQTKGKGFAGGVKRWGFKGGPGAHGSMFHRAPGSIGASSFPSRVFKGKRLPGHYGASQYTIRKVKIVGIEKEKNLLLLKGGIPGNKKGIIYIRKMD